MAKRRGSIPILMSAALMAVGLIGMGGAMTIQNYAAHHAGQERWRNTAEQAARSGLDFVLGWGETNIDQATQLPRDWDMANDNAVIDPVAGYLLSRSGNPTVRQKAGDVTAPGEILGKKVGEYVLSRNGNYLTTFKVRLQQFRVSDDAPRLYRIGVIGRVRHINPGNDVDVDADEKANLVAERMVTANLGQEPFAKYALVNDIDMIGNWIPGDIIDGPVHINRGYVDDTDADRKSNLQPNNGTFQSWHSLFNVNVNPGSGFSTPPSAAPYPIFKDLVTLTAINDGNYGNTFSDDDFSDYSTVLTMNNGTYGSIAAATAQKMFTDAANQGQAAFGGKAGPVLVPQPLELPGTIRTKLTSTLGVPTGNKIQDYPWFNGLDDGVYLPTKRVWDTTVGQAINWGARVPGNFTYGSSSSDYMAGCIYIRGNVEVMRMTTSGKFSYYLFQLGYGGFDSRIKDENKVDDYYKLSGDNLWAIGEAGMADSRPADIAAKYFDADALDYHGDGMIPGSVHRCYLIRVDRSTREVWMRAFPQGTIDDLYDGMVANAKPDGVSNLDAFLDSPQKKKKKGKKANPGGGAAPVVTDPAQFVVNVDADVVAKLPAPPTSFSDYPFNGVVFVDLSEHDPARDPADAEARLATKESITGNIFALGDPGHVFGNPSTKRKFGDYTQELVATNVGTNPSANTKASRLNIMAAGNIFIQNHLYLEALRSMGLEKNPSQQTFRLSHSHDSLGLVADRQIVIGNNAPSDSDPTKPGIIMHASIAALGDSAMDFTANPAVVPNSYKTSAVWNKRGSFGVEDIQQLSGNPEDYNVVSWHSTWPDKNTPFSDAVPGLTAATDTFVQYKGDGAAMNGQAWEPIKYKLTYSRWYGGNGNTDYELPFKKGFVWQEPKGGWKYPSNPLSMLYASLDEPSENPNNDSDGRGKILNFGSLVVKKRGGTGMGSKGYGKDYRYDRRLQSIAPPLYPTSANVILSTQTSFAPNDGPYKGGGPGTNPELTFMGTDAPY